MKMHSQMAAQVKATSKVYSYLLEGQLHQYFT